MNKRTAFLLVCLCAGLTGTAQTGNKAKTAATPTTAEECLRQYYFDEAETILKKNIATQKRKRQSTEASEAMLEQAKRGRSMMNATERVTFIDSFVVDRTQFLKALRISEESGRIDSYANFFGKPDSMGCTLYQSELGNKIYFAAPDRQGMPRLYSSDLIGDAWTPPAALEGLGESDEVQNFPFMLSDGVTLYYAAEGEESLGGYDIFVSRYDADSKQFLRPENIGMPFNSPANDYLFAWDEYNQLGWFVTDRNQPEDKVCLYVFIPNETREIYSAEETAPDKLRRLARLHSIAETWTDETAVNEARSRLKAALTATPIQEKRKDFDFVIDDKRTYTLVTDFQSPEARKLAAWWKESTADLQGVTERLDQLREVYSIGNAARRKQLERQILTTEQNREKLLNELKAQEKKIRNLEIEFLRK